MRRHPERWEVISTQGFKKPNGKCCHLNNTSSTKRTSHADRASDGAPYPRMNILSLNKYDFSWNTFLWYKSQMKGPRPLRAHLIHRGLKPYHKTDCGNFSCTFKIFFHIHFEFRSPTELNNAALNCNNLNKVIMPTYAQISQNSNWL